MVAKDAKCFDRVLPVAFTGLQKLLTDIPIRISPQYYAQADAVSNLGIYSGLPLISARHGIGMSTIGMSMLLAKARHFGGCGLLHYEFDYESDLFSSGSYRLRESVLAEAIRDASGIPKKSELDDALPDSVKGAYTKEFTSLLSSAAIGFAIRSLVAAQSKVERSVFFGK